jgi:hypothetical protein
MGVVSPPSGNDHLDTAALQAMLKAKQAKASVASRNW